jgi:hypothetical protein
VSFIQETGVFELGSSVFELGVSVFELGSSVFELGVSVFELGSSVFELGVSVFELNITPTWNAIAHEIASRNLVMFADWLYTSNFATSIAKSGKANGVMIPDVNSCRD